ncbi:MAG TPA: DUF885 domain-containing protein [Candidatus Polarisedimenticolia bacterium]|nr:DUF885 domain-containing protein [Candidatus Polarisedimenticolia bacterium]
MNPHLAGLIEEVLGFVWSNSPTTATAAGIHDHDHRLADYAPEAIQGRIRGLAGYRRAIAALRQSAPSLTPDESLDARILERALEAEVRFLEEVRAPFRDPTVYLDEILYGVYYLIQREFAPLAERARSAVSRLLEVPRLLRQARENLSDPAEIPSAWVDAALLQTGGSLSFLEGLDRDLVPRTGPAAGDLRTALRGALGPLKEYESHLRDKVRGSAAGRFAIGRDLFDFLLRTQHGLDLDAPQLETLGRDLVARTGERLEAAAREIDPDRPWQDLVGEWKVDHPVREGLVHDYRTEVDRAREFVRRRHLVTIPAGERLHVVETPPFQRAACPFAAYLAAGPFEPGQEGFLWVTPPQDGAPPDVQEKVLQDHLRPGIPATAAHEAYPGHHLQLTVANRIASKVRRHFTTPVLVEGWAFYCEQLMAEEGFYDDRRSRVLQLKDELWRACRVVIDVGLQTGGMQPEEAVRMLREVARLETPGARGEVLRYVRTPTQPMSYAVGKQEILRLREEHRRARRGSFSLQEFHDRLLSFGSIPVGLIREGLLAGSDA